jgi:PAS domain S-box-containing protein
MDHPHVGEMPRAQYRLWTAPFCVSLVWMAIVALAVSRLRNQVGIVVALLSLGAVVLTFLLSKSQSRTQVFGRLGRGTDPADVGPSEIRINTSQETASGECSHQASTSDTMTRSGLYEAPFSGDGSSPDLSTTGNFSIIDMVNRLEPGNFYWIESSLAEQEFLGWSFSELQGMSFLEIVHPNDRPLAEEALRRALVNGEYLGLVVRIKTAQGKTKAIEVNVGARYGSSHRVSHLRCHVADVTHKVRAEKELRLRTRELTQVNEQLRSINRELEELKNRYSDLYDNAPAMYFSLNRHGRVIDCNQTLLTSLERHRDELLGHSFARLLHESDVERFQRAFSDLLKAGSIDLESRWVRSSGELIDVWISARTFDGLRGQIEQVRCVAQDLTAKHRLEAKLRVSNQSLARANAELSRKNRELDEFVYVVSHDLQEPLRTLIAFSDFLLKDHSQRLNEEGRAYVQHLVEASRRMRSMIHGLLNLSRAGKVTEEFGPVELQELVNVVRTDLRELIRSRKAEVRLTAPRITLWGDRGRVQQLLSNLISNGIKYNQSTNPCVEIGILHRPDEREIGGTQLEPFQTFVVSDNGIGIEHRFHSTVFQLFRRLHPHEEYEGSGVGLAICYKIVEAHKGRIWVESEPGCGSRFFVSLPRTPMATTAIDPARNDRDSGLASAEVEASTS